ncbi:MAG: TetM/TetW/TetO/TetS family tetracycline resistance ribosomal protection protein [Bacillota bacterium]|nr:TetM/TetW/TetO/TetS family tetracycline resistance ribosomal protection protein [Bacillota bacterium]
MELIMKKIVLGVLAHVDAGKTTLSEALLYTCGSIRKLGRVDHRDTALDTHELERQRGITIFSKQAQLKTEKAELCLLDTPGHMDFSTETERTLQVLDYAVLVISGTDGVQAHTETLWRLLKKHAVPTFIFVTKMDIPCCDRRAVMDDIRARLDENCLELEDTEAVAVCDEAALEHYMESGSLSADDICRLISGRKLFPVLFGSGLKLEGVDKLIEYLEDYTLESQYPEVFGAKVYKMMRDNQNNRLTCMKITGGSLKIKSTLRYLDRQGNPVEEKINGIRIYSGTRFESVDEAAAGTVCAVQGLSETYIGQGLGFEENSDAPELEPVLAYRVNLPKGADPRTALQKLRILEDEDPMLRLVWNEQLREIRIQLMGEVQTEILRDIIKERFDMEVTIDHGGIMYRETIKAPVEGVGHFEPLRHYAEVHLALEPLERGAGLAFCSHCPEDELDRNWQNLILTHLYEKKHLGVLTGSPVTDMKISLIAGRAHAKHTEGGDFRQAVYRAVRQGLMKAESVLLEPWYSFRIEVPTETVGRVISDVRAMCGSFDTDSTPDGSSIVTGLAPVSEMNGYAALLMGFTHGKGRISCRLDGYYPCHNAEKVIAEKEYNPEADLENTPDSVFCSHGAGVNIKWSEVESHMHIDTGFGREKEAAPVYRPRNFSLDDKELEAIMEREFGPIRRREYTKPVNTQSGEFLVAPTKREYLIIDGYNVIFGWDELKEMARHSLDDAREKLLDMLRSYRGFKDCELVLVFDGYKVQGNPGEKFDSGKVHIVYTKENETGDMYIEKLANDIGKNYSVRVVTNDSLIRLSALRSGVLRMSSHEFINELQYVLEQISGYTDGKR